MWNNEQYKNLKAGSETQKMKMVMVTQMANEKVLTKAKMGHRLLQIKVG